MSTDAGLALAQDLTDLTDGQFSVRQKMNQPQTRRFGDRAQVMHGTQQWKIRRQSHNIYKHIFIYLINSRYLKTVYLNNPSSLVRQG